MSGNPEGASAAFKLSTLETLGADPLMKPIDHALLGAYMKFMKWPARTAYLTNIKARINTSMSSEPTISASRARLVQRGYLRAVMTKFNGAVVFEINNPRADTVADHIVIAEETLREQDAFRKESDRIRRGKANFQTKEFLASNDDSDQRNLGDKAKEFYDNSLEHSLEEVAPKEEPHFQRLSAAHLLSALKPTDLKVPTAREAIQKASRAVGEAPNGYLAAKEGRG